MSSSDPPTRLARRLGTLDATLIGLGSMIGAGVFVVFGLAARAAGGWLLMGLALATLVAFCNAASSSELAAIHPSSGGAYLYGRERLGPTWGFLAGWGFVLGKTASCAAMAFTIGAYLAPDYTLPVAVTSVVLLSAINYLGVQRTASVVRVLVPSVLAVLVLVVAGGLSNPAFDLSRLWGSSAPAPKALLEAGALIFFAFAGYARIGTLGEEVRDPARTIPRAIVLAFSITLLVYAAVAVITLGTLGSDRLASSSFPLAEVVSRGGLGWAGVVVRLGAVVAASGALLTLLSGISRTLFAMAQNRDMPSWLGAVHEKRKTPHRAELVVAGAVILALVMTDLLGAVGFSSFLVLWYYAVANLSALRLSRSERTWPALVSVLGLVGCTVLAFSLPVFNVAVSIGLLTIGAIGRALWTKRP